MIPSPSTPPEAGSRADDIFALPTKLFTDFQLAEHLHKYAKSLESRVAELEGAAKFYLGYARHSASCQANMDSRVANKCACGLDDFIATLPASGEGWKV